MNYFGKHTEEVLLSTVYMYRNADTFEFTMRPVNVIILKKLIKSKSFLSKQSQTLNSEHARRTKNGETVILQNCKFVKPIRVTL